jgi:predicted dehydrogenase
MLNIAVAGCGGWGPNHVRNFSTLAGSRVLAVADPDQSRLRRIAEQWPAVRLEADWTALTKAPDIDAIVVATPTATHAEIVRGALRAGKHVLCEKPLCAVTAEARELADLAAQRRLVLMVGHVFLFNAGVRKLRELVSSGDLGEIRYLSAVRTNLGPIRSDVNVAYDLAAHDVSIFNWILGSSPAAVSASGGSYLRAGVEDVVFATLEYPGNRLAAIHASWLNPRKVRQITVVGSRKMVTWDDLELTTPIAIYNCGAATRPEYSDYGEFLRVSMWDEDVHLPKVTGEEPLKVQAHHFLDAVARGNAGDSDARFAVEVVRTLEAIGASLRNNSARVPLK